MAWCGNGDGDGTNQLSHALLTLRDRGAWVEAEGAVCTQWDPLGVLVPIWIFHNWLTNQGRRVVEWCWDACGWLNPDYPMH